MSPWTPPPQYDAHVRAWRDLKASLCFDCGHQMIIPAGNFGQYWCAKCAACDDE